MQTCAERKKYLASKKVNQIPILKNRNIDSHNQNDIQSKTINTVNINHDTNTQLINHSKEPDQPSDQVHTEESEDECGISHLNYRI